MLSDIKDNCVLKTLFICFHISFTKQHLKKIISSFYLSSFAVSIFNFHNKFKMNLIRETDVEQVIRDANLSTAVHNANVHLLHDTQAGLHRAS